MNSERDEIVDYLWGLADSYLKNGEQLHGRFARILGDAIKEGAHLEAASRRRSANLQQRAMQAAFVRE